MRFIFPRAAAAGLLALAACRDGTGPQVVPDLTVEVTVTPGEPHVLTMEDGGPAVGCTFVYSFNPVGDAGASAVWKGGTLRFFVGPDRTAPFDSLVLTVEQMNTEFGQGLRAGTRQSGTVGFLATVPYGMEAEFRYAVPGGRTGAATVYAPCLVPPMSDGSAPPAVSGLQVSVPPGPLEAGDTIRVSWRASSTTGLWESGVVLSGAFEGWSRASAVYQKDMAFTAEFVVPRSAALGEHVRVHAYALDLLVRESPVATAAAGTVTDVTAPLLASVTMTGYRSDVLAGEFEAGRAIRLQLSAHDGGRLAYLVYEMGTAGAALRDSVPLDTVQHHHVSLSTRTGLTGEGWIRLYVRDAAGNRSRVVQSAPGDVHFYPGRPVLTRQAALPFQAADHVVDAARGRVVVAGWQSTQLRAYSLPELGHPVAVDVGARVSYVDVAPDGRVVALLPAARALSLVDVAAQRVVGHVILKAVAVDTLYGFGITAGGRALVLARRAEGGGTVVLEYDLASGTQRVRTDAPNVPFPGAGVAVSLDRSRLLLGAGCVYHADTDAFGPCAPLWDGGDYHGGRFTGSGTGAYWANASVIYDASLRKVRDLAHVGAFSADDRYAYVRDADRVLRSLTSNGRAEDALVTYLLESTRATPDGRLLVSVGSVDANNHQLRVVELP